MAADFEAGGSPLYAQLARRAADDALVGAIVGDLHWDVPLRLMGGVHYLVLAGSARNFVDGDPWPAFRAVLEEHREWLARFVAEQPVQTNEVRRSWGLLPGFLDAIRRFGKERPVDLVELGPSGGLNLLWDRYRYRYRELAWGRADARLELEGEARGGPPEDLLGVRAPVRRRVGIDKHPVDVASDHGARLLQAFVWAGQRDRLERLRRAIEIARAEPPQLLAGDYVERLPELLAARDPDALTLVFHSASAVYLRKAGRERLREAIEHEGEGGGLAWVSAEAPPEGWAEYHGYALEVQVWPGGERRRLARVDGHAKWLEWLRP